MNGSVAQRQTAQLLNTSTNMQPSPLHDTLMMTHQRVISHM
jgi:hypothetical protein